MLLKVANIFHGFVRIKTDAIEALRLFPTSKGNFRDWSDDCYTQKTRNCRNSYICCYRSDNSDH